MNVRLAIPLLIQEGWLRHQEKDAKPPQRRRRGGCDWRIVSECVSLDLEEARFSTTPSAPLKEAPRLLPDVGRPIHSHILDRAVIDRAARLWPDSASPDH